MSRDSFVERRAPARRTGTPLTAPSKPLRSRVPTLWCISRVRALAITAGPPSTSVSSSIAACWAPNCWRQRSPRSTASPQCFYPARPSASTAHAATKNSMSTAVWAAVSWPTFACSGKRPPLQPAKPACAWLTCEPALFWPSRPAHWRSSCRCSSWVSAASSATAANGRAGSHSTTKCAPFSTSSPPPCTAP
ncbi:unannotated protein [freshwater metagenome]|uniref:Unannotated protein n=1 Tax=freshwater metagenome TaxID=449393 RepID=A0A6J6PWQ0_9ZZZZ